METVNQVSKMGAIVAQVPEECRVAWKTSALEILSGNNRLLREDRQELQ